MIFTLTDLLLNDIVSALENQEKKFFVDAEKGTLVEDSESVNADENYYYELPEWNSADGFRLREEFVSNLLDPIVHEKLQDILHSGRGVFKNFRNIIKEYPEIEKRWHIYKNRAMHKYINQWYTCFAAGAVVISIPIAALFLYMQKFYVEGMTGAVKG